MRHTAPLIRLNPRYKAGLALISALWATTPAWPDAENVDTAELAEAKKEVNSLREQIVALQAAKSEAEKRARSVEPNLNERSAAAKAAADRQADLLDQLGQLQILLRERDMDLVGQKHANTQLRETNKELDLRLAQAQRDFKTVLERQSASASGGTADAVALKTALAQATAQVVELQRELATARQQPAAASATADTLKQQLVATNAALGKSNAGMTELTATKERLERELQAAEAGDRGASVQQDPAIRRPQELADITALREENTRLRQAAAGASETAEKNAQLTRDNEQLTAFMNGNRNDLDEAQALVAKLEKQLLEATTVRTEGGEGVRKIRAELDDANHSVEKLSSDVAELTAANEKLEMDLDSARKSTAAALAAQSQAVSAASPDSYQMEIGTLNAQVKQLESHLEEERTNAAREVATLASQLQRTRDTNRSLTEANRALMGLKDGENSATKDEVSQLQARIKELTAVGEDLRRQGQVAANNVRTLTAERDDLKSQLVDARQVATTLPGLADEKAALQERLETVGAELVRAQRDEDALQKANADLTRQLAASEDATEKAKADLAVLRSKVTDAEKTADLHTVSVADLTAANGRLEQERDDLRRLVETYSADIARLNQAVRNSEQQRADAERGGQQGIDAVTAQLTQLRRELEAARVTQARFSESYAAQERERSATIAQLRSDNGALTARLSQAQGTLDQIAAAARLGTPASTIAAGGVVPVVRTSPVPTSAAGELRVHTVSEGDSLSRISMRFYGTPNRWQEVYQANRDILQGSSALRVGQQLRIP